jgi:3-hydroxyisobutyrate dehydrogenase-like beta-hydroxyacid dehydrogenase
MQRQPIGMIGLGLLGSALAERMLRAGFSIFGFDQSSERTQEHAARGGQTTNSIDEIAAHSTIVLCLPDSKIVSQVVEQILPLLKADSLLIDATTGDPEDTVALAKRLHEQKIAYIDATVGGSSQQVREGTSIVMVGGDSAAISSAQELLDSWGKQWFHVGAAGSGARMKLVLNLALGLQRAVLAEALALAAACEIEPAAALQILRASPAYSICMDTKGPKMLAGDFTPQARLAQHHKDVQLIQALATRAGANVPLSNAHEEILQRAIALGWGDADNSAILCAYQNRSRDQ